MRRSRWIFTAVAVSVLTAACGSTGSPSPSTTGSVTVPATTTATSPGTTTTTAAAGTGNSCSYVTAAQAGSALGETVSSGVLGSATVEGGLACVFYGPSAPTPHNPNVAQADSVRVVVVSGADATKWFNDYKSKVNAQSISGYGDQAYYDGYASLSILKGDTYVRIAVAPAAAAPSLSAEEKLATAILPSL